VRIGQGGPGATEAALARPLAADLALAGPGEGRGGLIPAGDGVVEPADQCRLRLRVLAGQGARDEDALERPGHVQPRAGARRVAWHDPVLEEPVHHRPAGVPGQIVPDEQEPQRRQWLARRMAEPGRPLAQRRPVLRRRHGRAPVQDLRGLALEPGMAHRIRHVRRPLRPDLARRRAEEGQQLDRPAAHVLVRLAHRHPRRLPARPGVVATNSSAAATQLGGRHGADRLGSEGHVPARRGTEVRPGVARVSLDQGLDAAAPG